MATPTLIHRVFLYRERRACEYSTATQDISIHVFGGHWDSMQIKTHHWSQFDFTWLNFQSNESGNCKRASRCVQVRETQSKWNHYLRLRSVSNLPLIIDVYWCLNYTLNRWWWWIRVCENQFNNHSILTFYRSSVSTTGFFVLHCYPFPASIIQYSDIIAEN